MTWNNLEKFCLIHLSFKNHPKTQSKQSLRLHKEKQHKQRQEGLNQENRQDNMQTVIW